MASGKLVTITSPGIFNAFMKVNFCVVGGFLTYSEKCISADDFQDAFSDVIQENCRSDCITNNIFYTLCFFFILPDLCDLPQHP